MPELTAGQRVRVLDYPDGEGPRSGDLGTLTRIATQGLWKYKVDVDRLGDTFPFHAHELELYDEHETVRIAAEAAKQAVRKTLLYSKTYAEAAQAAHDAVLEAFDVH